MKFRKFCAITGIFIIVMFSFSMGNAVEKNYSDYKSQNRYKNYFEINFNKKDITFIHYLSDSTKKVYVNPLNAVVFKLYEVALCDEVLFKQEGVEIERHLYRYDNIYDVMITDNEELTTILFRTRSNGTDEPARTRIGNRITFDNDIVVKVDDFVRGLVFTITGNIEMYGETNKDIISLFGDIYIGPGAVARGDIASIKGKVDIASDASVYGEIYSGADRRVKKKHTYGEDDKTVSIEGSFYYNRVDGATPELKFEFNDKDSLLPSIWASGGYAFNSERWRFEFGFEQILWRERPLAIGGSYFRRQSSGDDWLLDNNENTAFALFVTEDFKDYYEAEGGEAYLSFKPINNITFTTTYSYEETNWFESRTHLWSMFGGDKLFRDNFSSVEKSIRTPLANEIDSTINAAVQTTLDWNTLVPKDIFSKSAWHITGSIEWSNPDLGSDFDYNKYILSVRRYQKIHKNVMLMARGIIGDSKGYLPMYKTFYLGGIGTLRGYKYKEFAGSKFWMTNLEYRLNFPKTDLGASILWDAGQVSDEDIFDSNTEVKHSIGLALHIGSDIRLSISKRLDRSFDDNPRIHVRLDHVF